MMRFLVRALPYAAPFVGGLVLSLFLTPLARAASRALGMVDRPDPRRINKVPVPRGGGIAIVIAALAAFAVAQAFFGGPILARHSAASFWKLMAVSVGVAALGYADDKFSLKPLVKLAGQLVLAFLAWCWANFGFSDLWPSLPGWLDAALTVLWLVGAMNAFNLIDGLDGLASGIALIATTGILGALALHTGSTIPRFSLAFAGAILGFLRYNAHPASVFLGDAGSMYLGFIVASLPLMTHATNSFLVSVGVPLLAMGVPIIDTSLAILRRSVRRLLAWNEGEENTAAGKVMTADTDHLHHRILRAMGLDQRKAVYVLYAAAFALVALGLLGVWLSSRAEGLWLFAFSLVAVIVVRALNRIELYDAGRLLEQMAHTHSTDFRRRFARLTIPAYLVFDLTALTAIFFVCHYAFRLPLARETLRVNLPIRVVSVFVCLVLTRTYVTSWSRAQSTNFVRLALACAAGAILGAVGLYYAPGVHARLYYSYTLTYAALAVIALASVRVLRLVIRDGLFALNGARLKARRDVERILVYGTGRGYAAFRRTLMHDTAASRRIIVGLLDDDYLLKGRYVGELKVFGTLADARDAVEALNADTIVIANEAGVTEKWLDVIRQTLAPMNVKVTLYASQETLISLDAERMTTSRTRHTSEDLSHEGL